MSDDNNRYKKQFKRPLKGGELENGPSKFAHIEPVQAQHLEVKISHHMPFDRAFKLFRSLVQKERILSTYKEKQSFEKPSDKKRRKRKEMKRKLLELGMKESRGFKQEKRYNKNNDT
jgi:ribosomal protein S21